MARFLVVGLGVLGAAANPAAGEPARRPAKGGLPIVSEAVRAGTSPAVRSLPAAPRAATSGRPVGIRNPSLEKETPIRRRAEHAVPSSDGALQVA